MGPVAVAAARAPPPGRSALRGWYGGAHARGHSQAAAWWVSTACDGASLATRCAAAQVTHVQRTLAVLAGVQPVAAHAGLAAGLLVLGRHLALLVPLRPRGHTQEPTGDAVLAGRLPVLGPFLLAPRTLRGGRPLAQPEVLVDVPQTPARQVTARPEVLGANAASLAHGTQHGTEPVRRVGRGCGARRRRVWSGHRGHRTAAPRCAARGPGPRPQASAYGTHPPFPPLSAPERRTRSTAGAAGATSSPLSSLLPSNSCMHARGTPSRACSTRHKPPQAPHRTQQQGESENERQRLHHARIAASRQPRAGGIGGAFVQAARSPPRALSHRHRWPQRMTPRPDTGYAHPKRPEAAVQP